MALADNLIVGYRLEEASGNAVDVLGARDATETGTIGSATGKVGNCRSFTGSQRFVRASDSGLQTGDVDFTFAIWMNFNDTWYQNIAGKATGFTSNLEWRLYFDGPSGRFKFDVSADGSTWGASVTANTFGGISSGTWYFAVVRHSASLNQIDICINGSANLDTTSWSSGVYSGSSDFTVGRAVEDGGGDDVDGYLDEVYFWKRYLSDSEIDTLYNSGSGLAYADWPSGGTSYSETMSGGVACSATWTAVWAATNTMSGGAACGGAGTITWGATCTPSGGAVLSNTTTVAWAATNTMSGPAVLGGSADVSQSGSSSETMSGGVVCGGTDTVVWSGTTTGSGGAVLSGSSTASQNFAITPSGGTVLSGTGTIVWGATATPAGGVTLGGSIGEPAWAATYLAGGTVTIGGSATIHYTPISVTVIRVSVGSFDIYARELGTFTIDSRQGTWEV